MSSSASKATVDRTHWTYDPRFDRVVTSDPGGITGYVRFEPRRQAVRIRRESRRLLATLTIISLCANLGMLLVFLDQLV